MSAATAAFQVSVVTAWRGLCWLSNAFGFLLLGFVRFSATNSGGDRTFQVSIVTAWCGLCWLSNAFGFLLLRFTWFSASNGGGDRSFSGQSRHGFAWNMLAELRFRFPAAPLYVL